MIITNNLNSGYDKIHVLYDINLIAKPKKITVILGPNGSGKSTLLKTIMGVTTMYSGEIKFNNLDISRKPPHERVKSGIAYLPQIGSIFSKLEVKENFIMAGYLIDMNELQDRLEIIMNIFPVLKHYMKRKAITLSGGERQMLAMAMALLKKPQVIMFDEPTANLAPKIAFEVFNKIIELKDDLGLTILLVEQNVKKALEIGDKAYLLVSGRIGFEGKAEELLEHPKLGKLYLGVTA